MGWEDILKVNSKETVRKILELFYELGQDNELKAKFLIEYKLPSKAQLKEKGVSEFEIEELYDYEDIVYNTPSSFLGEGTSTPSQYMKEVDEEFATELLEELRSGKTFGYKHIPYDNMIPKTGNHPDNYTNFFIQLPYKGEGNRKNFYAGFMFNSTGQELYDAVVPRLAKLETYFERYEALLR